MSGLIKSYGCVLCQKRHYEGDIIFDRHIDHQSKEGIDMRNRPDSKQTDLVQDFGFPDVPKQLKIGGKKK
jgi:hypothetical protein